MQISVDMMSVDRGITIRVEIRRPALLCFFFMASKICWRTFAGCRFCSFTKSFLKFFSMGLINFLRVLVTKIPFSGQTWKGKSRKRRICCCFSRGRKAWQRALRFAGIVAQSGKHFLTQSEPVLPQAEQLRLIFYCLHKTQIEMLGDLIEDTPLVKGSRKR